MSRLFPGESKVPATMPGALLYLGENFLLLPGMLPIKPLITAAWSLSYEFFYYLTIPLLVGAFRMREKSVHWRVGFFALLTVGAALVSLEYGGPVRLLMFIAGILLYDVTRHHLFSASGSVLPLVFVAAGLVSTRVPEEDPVGMVIRTGLLFVAFFMLCHTCFTRPTSAVARALSATPVRWLGNISYSYYLVHGLAMKMAFAVLGKFVAVHTHGLGFFMGIMVVMFAWTLVPSVFLFLFVERPFSLAPKHSPRKYADAPARFNPDAIKLANAPAAD